MNVKRRSIQRVLIPARERNLRKNPRNLLARNEIEIETPNQFPSMFQSNLELKPIISND